MHKDKNLFPFLQMKSRRSTNDGSYIIRYRTENGG